MLVDTAAAVAERARRWASQDPNETTASHVENLLLRKEAAAAADRSGGGGDDGDAAKELERLFPADGSERIAFGTAGLRSCMKPGPLHMNDLTVVQAAQGIARYCQEQFRDEQQLAVVIGYDHRANKALNLSSLSFALLTTLVFLEAGFEDCFLLDGYVATPLVPFTVLRHVTVTAIGIMITASHNPKQDAGYKVYWSDACQIRSPTDQGIAASILQHQEPWIDYREALRKRRQEHPSDPCLGLSQPERTAKVISAYFGALKSSGLVQGAVLSTSSSSDKQKPPVFVYTAMHGVAHSFAVQAFRAFGLPPFHSVPAQQEPDPDFPTVAFPNPEEYGALDQAMSYAEQVADDGDEPVVILANDPDGDRLAVAERCDGKWTVLTGDQIGTMLGHWLWQLFRKQSPDKTLAMCASTVSSKMLAEMARVEGFLFEDTLTGFKWIGSRAAALSKMPGTRSIFCYEEAIGFCCGDVIFDKDGISAAAVFAEMTLSVYCRQGKTLQQHMQSLYDQYGEFVSNNGYFFLPPNQPETVKSILDHMTNHGNLQTLTTVGPYAVESIRYLGEPGYDSQRLDKKPILPTSKSSPMMTIGFKNGCVAQFRASGTEPKFKYYIELKGKPGVSREKVERDLAEMSEIILDDLLQPSKNALTRPSKT